MLPPPQHPAATLLAPTGGTGTRSGAIRGAAAGKERGRGHGAVPVGYFPRGSPHNPDTAAPEPPGRVSQPRPQSQ